MDRLCVRNFGAIESVDFELKDLVVFIGRQSSGKSTLSKLIAIFKDEDFLNGINESNNASDNSFFKKYGISNYFKNDSYIKFESKNYYIEYSECKFIFELNKNYNVLNFKINNNNEKIVEDSHLSNLINDSFKKIINERYISDNEKIVEDSYLSNLIKDSFKKIINERYIHKIYNNKFIYDFNFREFSIVNSFPIYIPAERIFVSSLSIAKLLSLTHLQVLSESMYNFAQMYYEAIENINEFDLPVFDIKFKNDKENFYIIDKEKIKLSESASGYQSLIPTLLLIEFYKKTKDFNNTLSKIYVFEEPELNIFPDYQHKLVKHLVKKCLNTNTSNPNKLIITTHSPYILTSINNLLLSNIISKQKPNQVDNIKNLIDEESWIDPNNISVFFLNNGQAESIINPSTGLITDNDLDSASEEILNEYSMLMDLLKA